MTDIFDEQFTKRERAVANEVALRLMSVSGGSSAVSRSVLETQRYVRENGGAPNNALDWGYVGWGAPMAHLPFIYAMYPDLKSNDQAVKKAALKKWLADPRSEPYRVRKNDGKRIRNT